MAKNHRSTSPVSPDTNPVLSTSESTAPTPETAAEKTVEKQVAIVNVNAGPGFVEVIIKIRGEEKRDDVATFTDQKQVIHLIHALLEGQLIAWYGGQVQ